MKRNVSFDLSACWAIPGEAATIQPAGGDAGDAAYFAAPGVSQSMLKQMSPTPAHFRQWADAEAEPPTPNMMLGTLVHARLLEPVKPLPRLAVVPDCYPAPSTHADVKKGTIRAGEPLPWNFNAAVCKLWRKEQWDAGKIILARDKYDNLCGALDSLGRHPLLRESLEAVETEVCITATHPATGLRMKSKVDILPTDQNYMADIKVVQDAGERAFAKIVADREYFMQAAYYLDIYNFAAEALGLDVPTRRRWALFAVEENPPHCAACYLLDEDWIAAGRALYTERLATLAYCVSSGRWPGYGEGAKTLMMPAWARRVTP